MWRTKIKQNIEAETQKHETRQSRSIWFEQNKEIKAKRLRLGFLGMSMCAYGLRMQPSCIHTHTLCLDICGSHVKNICHSLL